MNDPLKVESEHNDMRDLSERIGRALLHIIELRSTVEYGTDTYKRLTAKLDGVALVGSYVDEYLRTRPDVPTSGGAS